MQTGTKLHTICPQDYAQQFTRPVHRIGMITCGLAVLANLLPPAWLYLQYGVFPPAAAIAQGMGLALTYAVPFFIIEPIIYYPVLGDAGTYMSFLSGNISNVLFLINPFSFLKGLACACVRVSSTEKSE